MPIFKDGTFSPGALTKDITGTVYSIGATAVEIPPIADQKQIRIAPRNYGYFYYGFSSGVTTSNSEWFRAPLTIDTNTSVWLIRATGAVVTKSIASSAGLVTEATDTINFTSHGFSNGQQLLYTSTTTAIGGLTSGSSYFVVSSSANAFKLSLTSGGSAIDLTNDGVGTHTFNPGNDVFVEQGS